MNIEEQEIVPRGVCPACCKPIDRHKIIIVREFPCPHCHHHVGTSKFFRIVMDSTTISLAVITALLSGLSLIAGIVVGVVLWFVFNFFYVWVASIIRPRLELFRGKAEDFQTLNLGK